MKKTNKLIVCFVVLHGLLAAASSKSSDGRQQVKFRPADVIITAIINQAHNPISVMHAQIGEDDTEWSGSIPAGESSANPLVCSAMLNTAIPFEETAPIVVPKSIAGFHITTGHGTYIFTNDRFEVAAYTISRDFKNVIKRKSLLAPWPEERRVELVIGHDGKLQMRLPGTLFKRIIRKKSQSIKNKTRI